MEDNLELGTLELGPKYLCEALALVANENRSGGPSLSVHKGRYLDGFEHSRTNARRTSTWALAQHMRRCAWSVGPLDHRLLWSAAQRLESCVTTYRRCGHSACPRCNGRKARRYRQHLERQVGQLRGRRFGCVTLTMPTNDPIQGHKELTWAFGRLRRRVVWKRAFEGGEHHVQLEPSRIGTVRRWNLHTHALLLCRPATQIQESELRASWSRILYLRGRQGSLYLDRSPKVTGRTKGFSPVSFYISRRQYSGWVDDEPEVLARRIAFHQGRRLTSRFGCFFRTGARQKSVHGCSNARR